MRYRMSWQHSQSSRYPVLVAHPQLVFEKRSEHDGWIIIAICSVVVLAPRIEAIGDSAKPPSWWFRRVTWMSTRMQVVYRVHHDSNTTRYGENVADCHGESGFTAVHRHLYQTLACMMREIHKKLMFPLPLGRGSYRQRRPLRFSFWRAIWKMQGKK